MLIRLGIGFGRRLGAQRGGDGGDGHRVQQPGGGDLPVAARTADRAVRDVPGELSGRLRVEWPIRRAGQRGYARAVLTSGGRDDDGGERVVEVVPGLRDPYRGVLRCRAQDLGELVRVQLVPEGEVERLPLLAVEDQQGGVHELPGRLVGLQARGLGRPLTLGRKFGVGAAAQALGAGHGVQPAAEQPGVRQTADSFLHGDQRVVQGEGGRLLVTEQDMTVVEQPRRVDVVDLSQSGAVAGTQRVCQPLIVGPFDTRPADHVVLLQH